MFSSISVAIIVLYKSLLLRYCIGSGRKTLHRYNSCTCTIGLLSAGFLLTLSAFPLSVNKIVHTSIAIPYFVLCMCHTCLDAQVSGRALQSRRQHKLRLILCTTQAIFGVLFIFVYPVARNLWTKNNPYLSEDLKDPSNKMFGFLFVVCLFEWLMYIAYVFYLLTFTTEFLHFRLALEAVPCNDVDLRTDSNNHPMEAKYDVTDETTPPSENGGLENSSAEAEAKSV